MTAFGPRPPKPGDTRLVVDGDLERCQMLGADGEWRPLWCVRRPPRAAGGRGEPEPPERAPGRPE